MVATSPASARAEPDTAPPHEKSDTPGIRAIGGPVWVAWREGTLTRAKELAALCEWVTANAEDHQAEDPHKNGHVLADAIRCHLEAAKQAARAERLDPNRHVVLVRRVFRNGPLIERAMSNLDAAEAQLLNLAPASYLLGQMPSLLRHVQCHLAPADPARQEFERIARSLGINHPDHPNPRAQDLEDKENTVRAERGKIVTTVRAASSAGLRERVRLRNFRNVVVVTTVLMALLAIGVALMGLLNPRGSAKSSGVTRVACR
jgi:hypothetical protein